MRPEIFGWQHLTYLAIFIILSVVGIFYAKKYAKSEKSKTIITKSVALVLLISIIANRISIVLFNGTPDWAKLIPDSFCGMSSLVLSTSVLFGKKNNSVLHFVWFISLIGGLITMVYPDFIGQNESIFYLPTISGLIHHSLAIVLVVLIISLNQLEITYKKWYCTPLGFACYFTVGAFLMTVFGYSDAFDMANPILSGTPLTAWVMAPIYLVLYSIVLIVIELLRKQKLKKQKSDNSKNN